MNDECRRKISGYLLPNEKLLWTEKPKSGIRFRLFDFYLIPFSVLWMGLAIFIYWRTEFLGALIFVAVGIYVIFGRFWVDSKIRSKTYYGLTNRRVIIISGLFSSKADNFPLNNLGKTKISVKADGSGNIIIRLNRFKYTWPSGLYWPFSSNFVQPTLEFIPNVNSVYNEILSAQESLETS